MIMAKFMTILSVLAGIFLLMPGCSNELELPSYKPPTNTGETSDSDLLHFEGKAEPIDCGNNLVKRFLEIPNSNWGRIDKSASTFVTYPDVCAWLGAFWYAEAAVDNAILKNDSEAKEQALRLIQGLVDRHENVFTGKLLSGSGKPLITDLLWRHESNRVDYYIWGAVALHIASIMGDPKYDGINWYKSREDYLEFGLEYAEAQFYPYTREEFNARFNSSEYNHTNTKFTMSDGDWNKWKGYMDDGYSWQTRLWIDDMFMITALQMQAYQATKDDASYNTEVTYPNYTKTNNQNKFLDRAVREMKLYIEEIQGEGGLYWHSTSAHFFWARGNGWMAVGMPLMLQLIEDIPDYAAEAALLKKEYQNMMNALLLYQKIDGLWAQLIDYTNMWTETSGSAMFTYAFIKGVQKGWLDEEEYGAAAKKAWNALMFYLNDNYDIREVCVGTGANNSYQWYNDRGRTTGDTHGQAGMLWCATALTEIANDAVAKTAK